MPILVCPPCQERYQVPEHATGPVPCPRCGQSLRPPAAPAPSVPVTVAPAPLPTRRPGVSPVAVACWFIALLWILCSLMFAYGTAQSGNSASLAAPGWLTANVASAVGLAVVVERLCSLASKR